MVITGSRTDEFLTVAEAEEYLRSQPWAVVHLTGFATEAERDEVLARFPKFVKVKASTHYYLGKDKEHGIGFGIRPTTAGHFGEENKTTGAVNETGQKRIAGFIKVLRTLVAEAEMSGIIDEVLREFSTPAEVSEREARAQAAAEGVVLPRSIHETAHAEILRHADQMLAALNIVALTPHIRTYLEQHDPQTLQQVQAAILGLGGPLQAIPGFPVGGVKPSP